MSTEIKDTLTVLGANGGAWGVSLSQCNEMLQLFSLVLAISYTIYKMLKLSEDIK
jgi:hypothetical protein|tara:strand:- start:916 stop:1080 length:165 start_codon:yes stop_codon:yes gene_type:complete